VPRSLEFYLAEERPTQGRTAVAAWLSDHPMSSARTNSTSSEGSMPFPHRRRWSFPVRRHIFPFERISSRGRCFIRHGWRQHGDWAWRGSHSHLLQERTGCSRSIGGRDLAML